MNELKLLYPQIFQVLITNQRNAAIARWGRLAQNQKIPIITSVTQPTSVTVNSGKRPVVIWKIVSRKVVRVWV